MSLFVIFFYSPGYSFVEKHQVNRSQGGVCLPLPEQLEYVERNDISSLNDLIESIFVEIPGHNPSIAKTMIIDVIYQPPDPYMRDFINLFTNVIDVIKSEKKVFYLIGDWNINILNYETDAQTWLI